MSYTKEEMQRMIEQFLDDGGEIMQLKYASQKDVNKSQRKNHHMLRKHDSSASMEYCERERTRESGMIFGRNERWSK